MGKRRPSRRRGSGLLTAVTLLFLAILAVLGTAAATFTSRATVAVHRHARRQLALAAVRAAVNEASRAFEAVVNGSTEAAPGEDPDERLQELLEGMGPVVGFVAGRDGSVLRPPVAATGAEPSTGGPRLWRQSFRTRPGQFRTQYQARWSVRGFTLEGLDLTLSPVDVVCIFCRPAGAGGYAGTLSFRSKCSIASPGVPSVTRGYEVRRRFVLPAGREAPVEFLPAPLGIYVDAGMGKAKRAEEAGAAGEEQE